jgi:hypothetical protein
VRPSEQTTLSVCESREQVRIFQARSGANGKILAGSGHHKLAGFGDAARPGVAVQ